ncbi:MAG: C39 family peptidase [Anaerolineales bacterium]|nr:C39 family peptidase [Anaerolineales bacterium]
MDYSLSRKIVSRKSANTSRQLIQTGSWPGVLTAAVLLTLLTAFLSTRLLQLNRPVLPLIANPVLASAAGGSGIYTGNVPFNNPVTALTGKDLLDAGPASAASSASYTISSTRLAPQISIEHSSNLIDLTYQFVSGSDAVSDTSPEMLQPSLSELTFLEPGTAGQEFLWNGASRQVLYYLGSSRFQIALTMDLASGAVAPDMSGSTPAINPDTAAALPGLFSVHLTMNASDQTEPVSNNSILLPMEQDFHSQLYETRLPNACGPAATLIVLDYYGLEDSLNEVIRQMQEPSPRFGGYDPACQLNPVCTSPRTMARVFSDNYNMIVDSRSDWSFEHVYDALNRGNPVIADIRWFQQGGTLGHFVVIYGIDMETRTLTYHDPFTGAARTASWEQFSSRWSGPVDVNDPLQPQGFSFWGMEIYPPPAS